MRDRSHSASMSRLTCVTRLGSVAAVVSGAMTLTLLASGSAHAGQFHHTDASSVGTWTVPTAVTVVQVVAEGGSGGDGLANGISSTAGTGGDGAAFAASLDVTAGEVVTLGLGLPGQNADGTGGSGAGGASGFTGSGGNGGDGNGGGGGGATVVRIDGTSTIVAGGGGGGGSADDSGFGISVSGGNGGQAGGLTLRTTAGSGGTSSGGAATALGGNGATQSAGGSAGSSVNVNDGSQNGASNEGGDADYVNPNRGGGGGGGGYFGGGGGGAAGALPSGGGGGGGGSSWADTTRLGTNFASDNSSYFTGSSYATVNYIDFTTTTLSSGQVGSSYSQGVVATFGTATSPDAWSISPALPAGLSLNTSTGEITGTPTAAASGTYTVTASYTTGGSLIARSSTSFTLVISAAASPAAASTPAPASAPSLTTTQSSWTLVKDQAVILVPTANAGGNGTYSITPDLPEGLSLNQGNGAIGGVPTNVSDQRTYVLTVTNELGSSSASFSLAVDPPATITKEPETESKAVLTRFAPRSHTLTGTMRRALLEDSRTACSRGEAVQLVATVPSSVRAAAKTLAHRRGIKVRRFLRSQGCSVATRIELRAARTPGELRRVELV